MKISQKIAQLNLDKSLLIVTGSHHGIIYKIEGEELNKIDEHRVDTPEYSDNEGMFQRGGVNGQSFGSVLEPKKNKAQDDFSKEFTQKIQDLCDSDSSIKSIYLFAPSEIKGHIADDWSNKLKELVEEKFDGNYTTKQPSELMDMMYEKISLKNTKEATGEAKEILDKADQIK